MRAIGYARVSTTKQDLNRQKIKIRDFCLNKGYELIEIIEDFGISGAILDREGYEQLKQKSKKDADILIVSELSRLSRHELITQTLNDIQDIALNGLSVILLDAPENIYEAYKPLGVIDVLVLVLKAWGAVQERNDIKLKHQEGKMSLLEQHPYAVVDSKIPYGFKKVLNPKGDRPRYILEEEPTESVNIRKMFDLTLSGYTLGMIADYFNERNITLRGYYSTVAILGNYIHSKIYMGIRTRTQTYGREDNPKTIEVKINPIVSEEVFLKAQELIKINNKYHSQGHKNHNPLKGIIRCRCGRAMIVKDKKPQKGISKLTYRCSCNEKKSHPNYCTYGIDEINYDLTNEIIYGLFKSMNNSDFVTYFRNQNDSRVNELQEEIQGISKQVSSLLINQNKLNEESNENAQRFILTTNPTLINALQNKQNELDSNIKIAEQKITELRKSIRDKELQIERIKDNNGKEKLYNLSSEEKATLFHKYLDKIQYIPVNNMKGFYKVQFLNGTVFIIAVRKTRGSSLMVSILPDKWEIDESTKEVIYYNERFISSSLKRFSLKTETTTGTMTIHEYFNSEIAKERCISIDYSYRKRYLEQCNAVGLNGRLKPLNKKIV